MPVAQVQKTTIHCLQGYRRSTLRLTVPMASVASVQCSRCHRLGHTARDCKVPFYCTETVAERHAKQLVKKREWEERQRENEVKHAAWAERQAAREARQAASRRDHDDDGKSEISDSAASTAATETLVLDQAEVKRRAGLDKDVRRLQKVLRDIERLQQLKSLDKLQAAKVDRKSEIEIELGGAMGAAEARARNELRQEAELAERGA